MNYFSPKNMPNMNKNMGTYFSPKHDNMHGYGHYHHSQINWFDILIILNLIDNTNDFWSRIMILIIIKKSKW